MAVFQSVSQVSSPGPLPNGTLGCPGGKAGDSHFVSLTEGRCKMTRCGRITSVRSQFGWRILLAFLGIAGATLVSRGQNANPPPESKADPILAKLDAAKKAYESEVQRLKKELLDTFDKKEALARQDGNKKLVDQILAERLAFTTTGELPKSIPTSQYLSRLAAARKALQSAYTEAIRELVRNKRDAEAALLEKELQDLTAGPATPAPLPADPRVRWVTPSGRRYEHLGGKNWREQSPQGGIRLFTEVTRNNDYIELQANDDRKVYVRLHATVYYWGEIDPRSRTRIWRQWLSPEEGTGRWVQP